MNTFEAAALGLLQGLTEFFPISSSGHLVIARWLFGWDTGSPAADKSFDAAVHLGTALAAAVFLRSDLMGIARAVVASVRSGSRGPRDHTAGPTKHESTSRCSSSTTLSEPSGLPDVARDDCVNSAGSTEVSPTREDPMDLRNIAFLVLLASLPAAVAGLLGEELIAESLSEPMVVAFSLGVFGVVLWVADRMGSKKRTLASLGLADALSIGLAQTLALVPGVSRSGITMTAGLVLGLDRTASTKFSFLLLLPITGGAGLYGIAKLAVDPMSVAMTPFVVGVVTSAVAGYAAAAAISRLVRTRTYLPFVAYRIVVSIALLAAQMSRVGQG